MFTLVSCEEYELKPELTFEDTIHSAIIESGGWRDTVKIELTKEEPQP